MDSGLFIVTLVLVVWGIPSDCAGQRYAILAPRTVRPYNIYEVIVSNIGTKREDFLVEIVSQNDMVVGSASVEVMPNEMQKVAVPLASLVDLEYSLKLWEHNKQALLNTTELEVIDRSYLVLFQTDKPAYKPGDKVQFRVVFLFQNSKPVGQNVTPTIFITDPVRVRMKQWNSVSLSNGVFEGSFQLAEYTSLGTWTITASVNEQKYKDTFSVEEYTLPLFRVQMQSMPHHGYFLCENANMTLNLRATYAHGGPVRGNATVIVRANYNNYPSQTKEVARKELVIDGTATVDFPTKIVDDSCDVERNVWFDVTVTESSTGISYNATSSYTIHDAGGVTMEVVDGVDAFYPGLPMKVNVKLASIDEKPLENETVLLRYKVLTGEQNEDTIFTLSKPLTTNRNGIIKYKINTTLEAMEINVEGLYNNRTFPLVYAAPMYEDKSLEYLVISSTQVYYVVGKNITVNAYSNVKFRRIYYVAYCRGKVCISGVQESGLGRNHQFVFASRYEMAPQMKFLAFVVQEDGKILSSALIIRFQQSQRSALSVTAKQETDSYYHTFNILAEKNAFVGLLGVDGRILHRTTANNDITEHKWEQVIQSQDDASIMWSSYDSFGSVGVTLLTDGYLPDVGIVPHSINDIGERSASNLYEDEPMRQNFPETWLWESLKAFSGNASFQRSLPDSVTTWVVSGFSVGPVHGLQILKRPIRIKSKSKIYIQFHMPPSIKRFEEITLNCLIHNYGTARNVSLEIRSILDRATLFIAERETKNVQVKISSNYVGVLTIEAILRQENGNVLDSVRQLLPVRSEGLIQTVEDVRLLNFHASQSSNFILTLPTSEINEDDAHSEVTLSVTGTIFNLNMLDFEEMVETSHGNGVESLLFLQTTMAVYDYLKSARLLSLETKNKLHSYMLVGYQQLTRYRVDDGSFSMFGSLHECGSVWFTASVIQAFQKLFKYEQVPVDVDITEEGLEWLMGQSRSGSFNETCPIAYAHIQRTGGKELSLASSVLFTFVGRKAKYASFVNKTLSLLPKSISNDVYLMAKTTYLFTLINHPDRFNMLEQLNSMAIRNSENYLYWNVTEANAASSTEKRNIEATAYALLANIKGNVIEQKKMIQIAHWLQKYAFACDRCVASLERVVVLEALGALAEKLPSIEPNMIIRAAGYELLVNRTNRELLQTVTLPPNTTSVNVYTTGPGLVLIKLSYRYSLSSTSRTGSHNTSTSTPSVSVNVTSNRPTRTNQPKQLEVCWFRNNYVWRSHSDYITVMLDLPTGYQLAGNGRYPECTANANELENKSRLLITYNVVREQKVCHRVPVIKNGYWTFKSNFHGMVYIRSFDTKDIVSFFKYTL